MKREMPSGGHRSLTAFILWPFSPSKKSPLDPPSPWGWLGAYLAFAQKIREFLMFRMRFRGVKTRTWIDRSQIQRFLQSAHPFVIHFVSAAFQFRSQTGNSVKWCLHINLHHFVLDPFVGSCPGNLSLAFVIKARMRNLKQLQLTIHA